MKLFQIIKNEINDVKKMHKTFILVLIILTIFGGIIPFFGIILTRYIMDSIFNQNINLINIIIILCSITCFFEVINTYLNKIVEIWFLNCRMHQFDKVNKFYLNIDYEYIEDNKFKDEFNVSTMALQGDNMGYQSVLKKIVIILPLLLSIIIYSIVIATFNIYVLFSCILCGLIILFVNKKVVNYINKRKEEKAKYSRQKEYFVNTSFDFRNGKDIRVYSLQDKLINDHSKKSKLYLSVIKNVENKKFVYSLLEILFIFLEDLLAYYFIIKQYFDGSITIGQVSMYISTVIAFSETIRLLTDNISILIKDSKYVETYYQFLNKNYNSKRGNKVHNKKALEIEFKNVSFKYPRTEKYILKNFNFKINEKEKLAIVGTNGAGKSTIIKLITGLYFPNEGEILINGIKTTEYDKKELEKMFSVVYQDIVIVAASILENIDGKNTDVDKAKMCLEKVGLKEKIESLPNQYDTQLLKIIDEKGIELSGGENQKLAIARALYKDADCVILDEPTSALDALKEAEIYQSFNDIVKDKTSIYISHRLSSTKFCDHIALFTNEGLKEYGTHDELMELKGEYYNMFITQGKYYKGGNE